MRKRSLLSNRRHRLAHHLLTWLLLLVEYALLAGSHPAGAQVVLSGTVTDSTRGQPVAGIRLLLSKTGGGLAGATNTDAEGHYRLSVDPGTYDLRLVVYSAGDRSVSRSLWLTGIEVEMDRVVDAVVPSVFTLSGRLLQPDGTPAAGVQISQRGFAAYGTDLLSDAQGAFRLRLFAGKHTLFLSPPPDLLLPPQQVEVEMAGDTLLDLALHPGIVLTGRLLDPLASPVENAQLVLYRDYAANEWIERRESLDDGRYTLVLPPEPATYTLWIDPPWNRGLPMQLVELEATKDQNLNLTLGESLPTEFFSDVTWTHLPGRDLGGASMDARSADLDGDGDQDLVVASEFAPNLLLINEGQGYFRNVSAERIPQVPHDSEDIGIADLDGDGDLDIVIVSEDDRTNEFYLNDGRGYFADAGDRLPVKGTSNAVQAGDVDGDGDADILIGNGGPTGGQNFLLHNDGNGFFTDVTGTHLPTLVDITQDLELGDVDQDGDLDVLEGNEDANRLLLNDGAGIFTDASAARLPLRQETEETREADFGDVDQDGDLDIFFANVILFNRAEPTLHQNRLLLNDGSGFFTDVTAERLPGDTDSSMDGDFIDLDGDGDLDLVTANAFPTRPYRAYLNDGSGFFADHTATVFPTGTIGNGFDIEAADFNGNGLLDLYLCSQGGVDRLLLGWASPTAIESTPAGRPSEFALLPSFPNPFNARTVIPFQLFKSVHVELAIYDSVGQIIRHLVTGEWPAGIYRAVWDGRDSRGRSVASGVYLCQLSAGSFRQTHRLALVK